MMETLSWDIWQGRDTQVLKPNMQSKLPVRTMLNFDPYMTFKNSAKAKNATVRQRKKLVLLLHLQKRV